MKKLLLALVLLSGCSTTPKAIRLGIAAQQSPSQMLTYLAQELGEFKREGLEVQTEEFPASSRALEALVGGSIDVVSGYYEQTLQLSPGAPPLTGFLVMTNGHLVALAARKAERVADLKGQPVGVTALGSSTHLWLNFLLAREGLKPQDVNPVAIGTAGRAVAAMEHGEVTAGVVSDFTARTLAQRFPGMKILADTRTPASAAQFYGVSQYPGAALYSKRAWLNEHKEEAARLAKALRRTYDWVKSHSPEEVVRAIPRSHHGQDEGLYLEVIRGTIAMLSPDGRFSKDGVEAARKLANGTIEIGDSYTNEILDRP